MKNIKKKIAVITSAVILATSAATLLTGAVSGKSNATEVRVVTLEKQDLTKTVSATGTVYSTSTTDVYSSFNYAIESVNVKVGDKVNECDVLATLDMSSLESDIKQRQAAVWASQASANQNLAAAKSDLETYKRNAQNGNDSSLFNAKTAIENAELDIKSAELDVESANNNLYVARRDLREARDNGEDDATLDQLRDNVRSCETAADKAQTALAKAKANLEKAKTDNKLAKVSSSDTYVSYQNKVKSAQASTNFSDQYIAIEAMQDDLAKSEISAPVSGTITSVNAVAGGSSGGVLFVIQQTENLKVITNIKEYEIAAVNLGDKVVIKSDATGDTAFEGILSQIAPTSTLTADGSVQNSTTAEYESEVIVSQNKKGLKIGMNARLSIITDEKKGVYAVPFEAVTVNENGDKIIYIAALQEDGGYIAEAVTVTTGMETDLRTEIMSDTLTDGALIIQNAEGIQSGTVIAPQNI